MNRQFEQFVREQEAFLRRFEQEMEARVARWDGAGPSVRATRDLPRIAGTVRPTAGLGSADLRGTELPGGRALSGRQTDVGEDRHSVGFGKLRLLPSAPGRRGASRTCRAPRLRSDYVL